MDKTVILSAILLGLAGLVAMNIKQIFMWIWNLASDLVVSNLRVDESSDFFYALQNYVLVERPKLVRNYYYRNIYDNFIDGETTRNINLFYNRGILLFKFNGKRILLTKNITVINNTMTPYKNEKQSFSIYTLDRNVLKEFADYVKINYVDNKIRYYFNNNGDTMVYGNVTNKKFENIFLNDNLIEQIQQDVDKFIESRELYDRLGLKYKRTYLFHGSAGGGKSSLATAIANHTKRDILTINLSKDMTDSTLISLIGRRPRKSIILFEDIDCLFEELNRNIDTNNQQNDSEKKEDKTPMMKITLSCLLNILDGSFTPNDVIFVITTNHLEKLDPALIRDGRVNFMKEIEKPNRETKLKYLNYLLQNNKNIKPENINLDDESSISTLEKNLF
jgi:ATP-dependent 26S proteasome regulatory subunit